MSFTHRNKPARMPVVCKLALFIALAFFLFLSRVHVASVTGVPEPAVPLLAGLGLALLLLMGLRNRGNASLQRAGLVAVLAAGPSLFAQSNPDFTNVDDILYGNRTLLQITDLQLVGPNSYNQLNFDQLLTSNSSVTKTSPFQATLPADIYNPSASRSFSGVMFNQPQPVTVTEVAAEQTASNSYLVTTNIQNAGPWFSPISDYNAFNFTGGAMADFNQDGYDDFAFGLDDGTIRIATAGDVNNPSAGTSGPFRLGPSAQLGLLADMTAGDFEGDGQHEIAGLAYTVVDGIELVIYTVDPKSLAITPASTLVLSTPLGYQITYASIARGRFNTTTHDQLAVAFSSAVGPSIVQIIDFPTNTLTPVAGPQLTASTVSIPGGYLQVTTGKFGVTNGDSYDQIVFHMSSTTNGGRFFEVLSVNPTDLTLTAHSGITYNQVPCAAPNGVQVGNFDNQQTNQHNPNAELAFLYCSNNTTDATLNIYSVNPQTFDVINPPQAYGLPGVNATTNFFVATDLQGRSMVLGEPTKVTINNTSPTAITALPPMHIDYITPVGGTQPEVLNLSYIPDGFNSSFSLTQESTTGASTTHTFSWSAGVDLTTNYSYTVGDPDDATGARFSAAFHAADQITGSSDNSTINFSTSTFDVTKTAKTADVVFYENSRMNIWVYPVIGQTACPATTPNCSAGQQKPLTIQFSGPDQIDPESISADLLSATWYQPPWEWGNVFSYPATEAQLALIYPDLANPANNIQLSTQGVSFFTDNSSTVIQDTWSSSTEQGSTSSFANTTSFDVTLSGIDSVGIAGLGTARLSNSLNLSGSVGFSTLQTNSSKINASDGVGIQAVGKFLDPGNYAYQVQPFILGTFPPVGVASPYQQPQANIQTFGPLKTAFTADPLQTGAWWAGGPYSTAPDIALNHPSRWIQTYPAIGNTLPSNCRNYGKGASDVDCADIAPYYGKNHQPLAPWNSEFLAMRGFFITRADNPGAGPQLGFATAGDQLDLAVRVYNYSLYPLNNLPPKTQLHVRFYAMPVDGAGNSTGDPSILIGEKKTTDIVPPYDDSKTDLNWRVIHSPNAFDTTAYAKKFFSFWVVVWMEDSNGLVKEIQGHGLTSIPGTLTKPSDVPLEMATATDGSTASYSNNVGFYHYAFPVLAPQNQLGATPPGNPADVRLVSVRSAKKHIKPGEVDIITALLDATEGGASNLRVYFYDGDPEAGGNLIAVEKASVESGAKTPVSIPYHAPSDGVHRIWAVLNKGQRYQSERHTSAIIVGKAAADRNNSDGDEPPDQKTNNGLTEN